MRKAAIAVGIICIVLIAGVAIFEATFDINKYRGTIQSELTKRLGRNVTLGEMHLSIFPPRFVVQNAAIADDSSFSTQQPFVRAQEMGVSVKLLPLLQKS